MHSLRTTLIGFSVVLVVVPGLLFAGLAFSSARSAIARANKIRLSEVAAEAADDLSSALGVERANLRAWARSEVMRDLLIGDVDKRVARFLGSSLRSGSGDLSVTCIDLEGRALAASDARDLERSFASAPWFASASQGREEISGPHLSDRYGRRVLEIAGPIVHPDAPGRRIGILVLVYDWSQTDSMLGRMRAHLGEVGSDVGFVVVDALGRALADSGGAAVGDLTGGDLKAFSERSAMASGRERAKRHAIEEPAIDALVANVPLADGGPDWRVLAVWPLRDALRPVYRLERQWLAMLFAILVAGIAIAALQSGRIVRPLRALTEATRGLVRGRGRRPRVEVPSRDEIGELAAAFNAMVGELEQAEDELVTTAKYRFASEMAAGVAHEVRTPLGVLRTSAQILGRSVAPGDEKSRELVEMMVEEVDRLDRVVAGLLELSRPREPVVEDVVLDELLARAQRFLEGRAAARNVTVQIDPAFSSITVRCDPEQMYQVVLNLLVNAIRAAPAGGTVTLGVHVESAERAGFEVIDDGSGIPADVREKIFTPFYTTSEGGTGLGLAVADRIVKAHRGSIEVDNAPGRGARFRVSLPVARPAETSL